jgi:hypothetical protein
MARPPVTLRVFFVTALLWLLVGLAVWFPLREWLVLPAGWLAREVMLWTFPNWVAGAEITGKQQVLLTHLRIWSADNRQGELAPEANALVYAYGAPLLAALMLASRTPGLWWKLPVGLLALLPFQAWAICFTWLMQVAGVAGEQTRGQTRFGPWQANAFAACYQLGFLILPTLAPVALWLGFDRRLLAGSTIGARGPAGVSAPASAAAGVPASGAGQ